MNPVYMQDIQTAGLKCEPRSRAPKTKVIPKRQGFAEDLIDAVDEDHVNCLVETLGVLHDTNGLLLSD